MDIEKEMIESGIARYRSKVESARSRESETSTQYGQRLMRAALPDLIKDVSKMIRYHKKNPHAVPIWLPSIWDIPPQVLSFLALKVVMDSISLRKTVIKASLSIANVIEDEVRYKWLKENHPEVFKYADRDVKKAGKRSYNRKRNAFLRHEVGEAKKGNIEKFQTWCKRDKVGMGTWFLESIRKSTHFISFITLANAHKKHGKVRYVSATDELFEWIRAFNEEKEILSPLWLPILEAPKDWTSVWSGGYTDADSALPALTLIKSWDMDYLREVDFDAMKDVVDAVNHVQRTPWTVNDKVLEVVDWAWENDKEIGDMPRRSDYERPPWPKEAETDPAVKKEWSRKAGRIFELNLSLRSQRLQTIKTLHLAKKFRGKKFYYPHQCDFRGRVYPIPYYLTPQGTDLARSLLLFAEEEMIMDPTVDARWLAIHGANCFGMDKKSFDDREKWVHDKRKEIHAVYLDPKTNDWWMEADKPWQFLAFCMEWGELLKVGGRGFKTRLPVSMDASNNGIQILSLLARDEVGGLATNVTPSGETPKDLYGYVSERVNQRLGQAADEGDAIAKGWLEFGVDRKATKRPVMVMPYGGTRYSCRAYVGEWYQDKVLKGEKDPFVGEEIYNVTHYIGACIWDGMNEVLTRPQKVMKWLQTVARTLAKEDQPLYWTTPLGFPVKQRYAKQSSSRILTTLGERQSYVYWQEEAKGIDKNRQANGVSPNFVHSLDAACLHKTVLLAKEMNLSSLAMVHDSYGTHSTKCEELAGILRHAYATIFDEDLLLSFSMEVATQTKEKLPELPDYGTLNPQDVRKSDYFFA